MLSKTRILVKHLLVPNPGGGQETIEAYERAFAERVGSACCAGFWKGRVAFFAVLKALGIGPGDEVVMPGYTCVAVPAAVRFLGAVPVFVDIEPGYCTLDPDLLAAAITPRTRAVLVQHTYGYPSAGLDRVMGLCRSRSLPVIEDCCHALGTRLGGRHMGTFGAAGFFSTQWSKPYTTGLGGLLVCGDLDLYERVCRLRDAEAVSPSRRSAAQLALQNILHALLVYPWTTAIAREAYRWLTRRGIIAGSTGKVENLHWSPEYFRRMCAVQAAAGLHELGRIAETLEHRRRVTEYYLNALADACWQIPLPAHDAEVALLRVPVRVSNKDEILRIADARRVEIGDWFIRPLHSRLTAQEVFGYVPGQCPQAEKAAREVINLPNHSRVSLRCAKRIVAFLRETCRPA
ncbi:MAG: DegT/DnrJ/EryC1/StrS family aminotransferase [Phycisphaerae bacterium]|nr:DegT/DnrJ/EryC1/StrS family aminotransferase [Phycisphaerae bacterium]